MLVFVVLFSAAAAAEPTPAQRRHVDRLSILVEEHKDISRQLAAEQAKTQKDEENIRALLINLEALNKEIAYVRKRPAQEESWSGGQGKAVTAVSTKIPPKPKSNLEYEDWDIFNNFGKASDVKTSE